jgi:hypothetical protein
MDTGTKEHVKGDCVSVLIAAAEGCREDLRRIAEGDQALAKKLAAHEKKIERAKADARAKEERRVEFERRLLAYLPDPTAEHLHIIAGLSALSVHERPAMRALVPALARKRLGIDLGAPPAPKAEGWAGYKALPAGPGMASASESEQ